jgi:hypothetical protein
MFFFSSIRSDNVVRTLLALNLLALVPVSPANAAPVAAPTIDIADARALPLGSIVTLKGSLTVQSGAFSSSTFDEGFAIQDRSGGIYVSIATNLGLVPRRQVRVTGQLADSFGLLILVVDSSADLEPLGIGPKVAPEPFATGEIGETTEGLLVEVTGTITQPVVNDLPFGFKVFVNDGSGEVQVFVNASTGIDVSSLTVGQSVRLIGFSSQFDTHYEIDPRTPDDIKLQ